MSADLQLVVRFALGIVFVLSSIGKLRDPKSFADGVADYQILPASLAHVAAVLIIGLEGWLAITHVTGWQLAFSVPLGVGMLMSFAVAVGVNLGRGRALPCYCFGGHDGETISGRTLARLLLLLLCEVFLLANPDSLTASLSVYPQERVGLLELGLALFWAVFLLVVGSWLLSLPDFVAWLRPMPHASHPGNDSRGATTPAFSQEWDSSGRSSE